MKDFRKQEQAFTSIREKLEYGVYHVVSNLTIVGYTSKEPIPFGERENGCKRQWLPGEHWGDLFDCGWFHFTGIIPDNMKKKHLAVLVDLSAEGLIVDRDGNPVQGITSATSRNEFPLGLWGKRTIELKDCLNERGEIDFWGDFTNMDVEGQYRNEGRIKEACLAEVDDFCRDAFYDWQVCQSLFVGLSENGDTYGEEVGSILEKAAACFEVQKIEAAETNDNTEALMMGRHNYGKTSLEGTGEQISIWPDPETEPTRKKYVPVDHTALKKCREYLCEILSRPAEDYPMTYSSIGHSHLDLLFLWPERETPRKCARTMSTVMKMMDRFPEYKFSLSQAPVYKWLKADYPALYERMLERIKEGRLEVVGAQYIECDTNIPCGESLVRQLLYGKRFFRKEFGLDMKVGFLPDVFGYSPALPQLFQKAGVCYFTTNKLSMNDTNRFPRYTFWWYGMDGTKILSHMLPENSYTSASVPQMAIYGQYHYTDMDLCNRGLQLFGLGDGGGGPGYEHMERRRRSRNLKGTPPLEDEFIVDFFKRIEKNSDKYRSWHGEFYFERHQGTFTSIAKQKKWNRTLERQLHTLEWLYALNSDQYPAEWLKQCWEDVMLFQFHDCLPGSAIDLVYAETQARYAKWFKEANQLIEKAIQKHAGDYSCGGLNEPVFAVNPDPFERKERLELDGRELTLQLKPYETRMIDFADSIPCSNVDSADPMIMENDLVRYKFRDDGRISEIYLKSCDREILPQGEFGNELLTYADENTHWDIEKAYLTRPGDHLRLVYSERCDRGSLQCLHLKYAVDSHSELEQVITLRKDNVRLDFATTVDWREEYRMLRVRFPVDAVAETATCEIQFGNVKRPTHQNTTWDQAKFEVCAHKWSDISDSSGGLALLNDCKYGYKVWNGALDLCLLRSQNCPCEHGDFGVHSFTYAVVPHEGNVWDSGVIAEGYHLNYPVLLTRAKQTDTCGNDFSSILASVTGTVVLETIKKAEDSQDLILRFYEAAGGTVNSRIKLNGYKPVSVCNLLEEAVESDDLQINDDDFTLHFHAFEVQSLIVRKI